MLQEYVLSSWYHDFDITRNVPGTVIIFFVLLLFSGFLVIHVDILFPCFSTAPNASSYTNVVHVTLLKSTNNILDKHIENKLNIQTCLHLGHGRCSGHELMFIKKKIFKLRVKCC